MAKAAATMLVKAQVMQATMAAFRVLCLGMAAVAEAAVMEGAVTVVEKAEMVTVLQATVAPVGVATGAVDVDVDVGDHVGQPVEAAERVAAKMAAGLLQQSSWRWRDRGSWSWTGLLELRTMVLTAMVHSFPRVHHHQQQWPRQQHHQHQQQHHQHQQHSQQQHPQYQQHPQQHPQHQQVRRPKKQQPVERLWGKESS